MGGRQGEASRRRSTERALKRENVSFLVASHTQPSRRTLGHCSPSDPGNLFRGLSPSMDVGVKIEARVGESALPNASSDDAPNVGVVQDGIITGKT